MNTRARARRRRSLRAAGLHRSATKRGRRPNLRAPEPVDLSKYDVRDLRGRRA